MAFKLRDLVKIKFKSRSELGRRIRKRWKELAPRDEVVEDISISNRLGDLENDKPEWWESDQRKVARQAFQDVTGLSFADLPLAREVIVSAEFPQMRPFRPRSEQPLPLEKRDWFSKPVFREWIVTPAGAGRSFVVQWHRLTGTSTAVEVHQLADAAELYETDQPLVIGVEAPDPERDAEAFERLTRRAAVLVIAPFAPPRSNADAERPNRWLVDEWQAAPGWRVALLNWIVSRLEVSDSLLDAKQLHGWLEKVDPRCETFATPGDLVALCAFVHESGPPTFKKGIASRYLRERLKNEGSSPRDGSIWLRAWGAEVVESLVRARLDDVSSALLEPLERDRWATLVPATVAPRSLSEAEIAALLDRKRTSKADAEKMLRRRSGPEAIELLTSARLLRPHREGLALHPRWIVLHMARGVVREALSSGEPKRWGRWSVEQGRRELVDAELDEMSMNDLVNLAKRVVEAFDKRSLGTVGAVESVFAAFGRRFVPGDPVIRELRSLRDLQRSLLTSRLQGPDACAPRTRPGIEGRGEWLACCWSWSLFGPAPRASGQERWLFPGWGDISFADLARISWINVDEPGWTREDAPAEGQPPVTLSSAFERVLLLSHAVVKRCSDVSVPGKLAPVLVPAVALQAHRRDPAWSLRPEHVRSLVDSRWGMDYLLGQASQQPEAATPLARTLWRALAEQKAGVLQALEQLRQAPKLVSFLAAHLPPADFAEALTEADSVNVERVVSLPIPFRLEFVRYAIERDQSFVVLCLPTIESLSRWSPPGQTTLLSADDAPWLELLAAAGQSGWRRLLWRVAPQRALELTLTAAADDLEEWFEAAPARTHVTLLEHLAERDERPEWAVHWLRRRVAEGTAVADRAYALLES